MSGEAVKFVGRTMASIVQGALEVERLTGRPPVIVGGLAVLVRLSSAYRATTDLDVVDRLHGTIPHLEILRGQHGAEAIEPAAVSLPTRFGVVKIDELEVRQVELDSPIDDPGDRLHASAHAWAHDTASGVEVEVWGDGGPLIEAKLSVSRPGPLIAMKLQSIMNRSSEKQGTDLSDIVRLVLDPSTRDDALAAIEAVDSSVADDMSVHVDLWFSRKRRQSLSWMRQVAGGTVSEDEFDLVGELLTAATSRFEN